MTDHKKYPVHIREVLRARQHVYQHMRESALQEYPSLSQIVEARVYVKHENHNPGGSFKIRGSLNLMHHLQADEIRGVITFSTGNHGLSTAISAGLNGISATVVVPEGANEAKQQLIRSTGARLLVKGARFEETSAIVADISEREGLYFVHAANEPHLINGVGTEFLEIIERLPDIDVILLPIGAGSELAAAATVFKALKPEVEIFAVQAQASQAAYLSWKTGRIETSANGTFAGGFATGSGYELPLSIYRDAVTDFVLLSEEEILEGIALALKHTRNLAEGSGASTIAAAIKIRERLVGKNVVLQMSGCNEDDAIIRKVVEEYL